MFNSLYIANEKNYHFFATLIFNHHFNLSLSFITTVIIITVTNVT